MTPNKIFYKKLYDYRKMIKLLRKNFKVHVFSYEKVFQSYTTMKEFIYDLKKITRSSFKGDFKKKDFTKINVGLKGNQLEKKRLVNFKQDHKFPIKKYQINTIYFKNFYTERFKKKFNKKIGKISFNI